jgi:hypothetical protein
LISWFFFTLRVCGKLRLLSALSGRERIADSQIPKEGSGAPGKGLEVGDKVTVKLVSTDPQRGVIDFAV